MPEIGDTGTILASAWPGGLDYGGTWVVVAVHDYGYPALDVHRVDATPEQVNSGRGSWSGLPAEHFVTSASAAASP